LLCLFDSSSLDFDLRCSRPTGRSAPLASSDLRLRNNTAQIDFCVNHESFDSFLLLPIEIVVRKFRFDNFFIRLILSIFCFTSNLFSQYCQ